MSTINFPDLNTFSFSQMRAVLDTIDPTGLLTSPPKGHLNTCLWSALKGLSEQPRMAQPQQGAAKKAIRAVVLTSYKYQPFSPSSRTYDAANRTLATPDSWHP